MADPWCPVCCTRHELGPNCPGELLATDAERHGWRVSVKSRGREEEYGVLVAPTGRLWRARILTYPNMLWCVPGGRGTLKFLGETAPAAEGRARDYVVQLCKSRNYVMTEIERPPDTAPLANDETGSGGSASPANTRFLHSVLARFGEERPIEEGATADLSNGGLFIVTNRPFPKGRRLKIVLEVDNAKLPLNGVVAWIRARPEEGRQAGMGVQLFQPPALYRYYVEKLT